jgi:sugar-phosphatase
MECSAILFDLDGVLIDSTSCVERHWRAWAAKHGLDAGSILKIAHGARNVETMRLVAPHLDAEQEAADFAANEVADTRGVMAVEGASGLLAGLDGARWAVVTSCGAPLAKVRIEAAQLPMPAALITGSDVVHGKPDPEPYLIAAEVLAVPPANCVVIEDAPAGIRSGKSAGMRVIGIAFTYSRSDLLASGADAVVDRLADLCIGRGDARPDLLSITIA